MREEVRDRVVAGESEPVDDKSGFGDEVRVREIGADGRERRLLREESEGQRRGGVLRRLLGESCVRLEEKVRGI